MTPLSIFTSLFVPATLAFGGGSKQQAAAPAPAAPAPPPAPPAPARATMEARTLVAKTLPKRGMYSTMLTSPETSFRYGGGGRSGASGAATKTLLGTGIY